MPFLRQDIRRDLVTSMGDDRPMDADDPQAIPVRHGRGTGGGRASPFYDARRHSVDLGEEGPEPTESAQSDATAAYAAHIDDLITQFKKGAAQPSEQDWTLVQSQARPYGKQLGLDDDTMNGVEQDVLGSWD